MTTKEFYKLSQEHPVNFKEQAQYFETIGYIQFVNNIPYINYRQRFKEGEDKLVAYPITILIYSISQLSEETSFRDIEKIIELVTLENDRSTTIIDFDFPTYNIEAPWKSGLAQGFYLSYLLRVKALKNTNKYDLLIEKVFLRLSFKIEEGGFLESEKRWYEEYPTNGVKSEVLNGHLITVVSLIEYYCLFKCKIARKLALDMCNDLDSYIKSYSFLGWSIYCKYKKNLVNLSYHKLHISLLSYMINNMNLKRSLNIVNVADGWKSGLRKYESSFLFRLMINCIRILFGIRNRLLRK